MNDPFKYGSRSTRVQILQNICAFQVGNSKHTWHKQIDPIIEPARTGRRRWSAALRFTSHFAAWLVELPQGNTFWSSVGRNPRIFKLKRTFSLFLVALNLVCVMRKTYALTAERRHVKNRESFREFWSMYILSFQFLPSAKTIHQYISIQMRIYLQNILSIETHLYSFGNKAKNWS